jgi:hypothetical protein
MKAVLVPLMLIVAPAVEPIGEDPSADLETLEFVASILKEIDLPPVQIGKESKQAPLDMVPAHAAIYEPYRPDRETTDLHTALCKTRVLIWSLSPLAPPDDILFAVTKESTSFKFQYEFKATDDQNDFRKKLLTHQQAVARILALLEEKLEELDQFAAMHRLAMAHRNGLSRRWEANFEYLHARVELQIAYVYEYQSSLGLLRREALNLDKAKYNGWQLESTDTPRGDRSGRDMAGQARKHLKRLIDKNPGTVWAALAERDLAVPIGLTWKPAKLP